MLRTGATLSDAGRDVNLPHDAHLTRPASARTKGLGLTAPAPLSSATSRPAVPTISRRFVPGASPVVVTNTPLAPLAYSKIAVTSSSTSMSWWWPTRQMDLIELGIMPSIHLATDQAWAVI